MQLRSDHPSVEMRDQMVLDTLRRHPWATARLLSDTILEETGGAPVILTGSIYLPPWQLYPSLIRLERAGKVQRRQFSRRVVLWAVSDG